MTDTPRDADIRIDALLAEAARATDWMPAAKRRELLADLDSHLGELPVFELAGASADPSAYVAELLAAWAMPQPPVRPVGNRRFRAGPALVATVLVIAAAVVVAGGVVFWPGDGSTNDSARQVVVPMMYGLSHDSAAADLAAVGLRARVVAQDSPTSPGVVMSQTPAEGARLPRGSAVTIHVSVPPGGALLDALPTLATPATLVEYQRTPAHVVVLLAAYNPLGGPQRARGLVTIPGVRSPVPMPGDEPGLCVADFVIPLNRNRIAAAGVGGGGSGSCVDPRQLPRITEGWAAGYEFGVTSAAATTISITTPGHLPVTAPAMTDSRFPNLYFFLAPIPHIPTAITLTALDAAGRTLATVTPN